tara:strand:+ start:1203 stop:1631 length:429 start_codon:yes stop_codon:yes gene_type:complete
MTAAGLNTNAENFISTKDEIRKSKLKIKRNKKKAKDTNEEEGGSGSGSGSGDGEFDSIVEGDHNAINPRSTDSIYNTDSGSLSMSSVLLSSVESVSSDSKNSSSSIPFSDSKNSSISILSVSDISSLARMLLREGSHYADTE